MLNYLDKTVLSNTGMSFQSVSCTDKEPQTFCYKPGVKLVIDVKLYDEKAWKVSTTRFTLQVYAKNTTHCKYMLQVKNLSKSMLY